MTLELAYFPVTSPRRPPVHVFFTAFVCEEQLDGIPVSGGIKKWKKKNISKAKKRWIIREDVNRELDRKLQSQNSFICIRTENQLFFSKSTGQQSIGLHIIFNLDTGRDKKFILGQWCCSNFDASQKILQFNDSKSFLFCLVKLLPFCIQGFYT